MPTLLQRYKGAERLAYKRFTAHIVLRLRSVVNLLKRFIQGGKQSVSILVVAHTQTPPKGIRISLFGLAGIFLAGIAVIVLGVTFSGSVGGARAKVSASNAELVKAQAELDALKDQTAKLSAAYKEFQAALSPIMAASGAHDMAFAPRRLSVTSLFAKKPDDEIESLQGMKVKLDQSIPVVAEYGSMLGQIDSVKHMVPAIWPIGGNIGHISMIFGMTSNPFTGQSYFHTGIDCSTYRSGDPVVATGDGKVTFAGWEGGYGRCVIIAHAYGYMTRYGHMEKILVNSGQLVKQGQTIGLIGSSGLTTGPHTHYEVLMGKRYLDPTEYLWAGAHSHPIISGGSVD
jgi:murein DD-endopeptidase MepM/ murein hydrolase activator NlpD